MDCPLPSPLEYFAALVADDDSLSLTEAATAVALAEYPQLDLQAVQTALDELAWRAKRRVPQDAGAVQRLRSLHRLLYEEMGFAGNVNDYDDPDNNYLHMVLQRRRGTAISLTVLYLELAAQMGLQAQGLVFPGDFLVKLHLPMGDAVIDPMTGHSLSRQALQERLDPFVQADRERLGVEAAGGVGEWLGDFLHPADARELLQHLLQHLARVHRQGGDWRALLQIQHRQILLDPEDWGLVRERAQTLVQLGQTEQAIGDLEYCLHHTHGVVDRQRVQHQLDALREAGPPRWH